MSVRVAFVGKGGAGKSFTSATAARLLARRGAPVLALDLDTMPGLALSLGLGDATALLPADLAERPEGQGWRLKEPVDPGALVDAHALAGPDGVRLLTLGKLPGGVDPARTVAMRHVLMGFRREGWSLVGDLAAGTRQGFFGWASFARTVCLVVEPTSASILSGRRLARLGSAAAGARLVVVASRVREGDDPAAVARAVGLPLAATVPYDESVREAERRGLATLDVDPASPAVRAVADLVETLVAGAGGAGTDAADPLPSLRGGPRAVS